MWTAYGRGIAHRALTTDARRCLQFNFAMVSEVVLQLEEHAAGRIQDRVGYTVLRLFTGRRSPGTMHRDGIDA